MHLGVFILMLISVLVHYASIREIYASESDEDNQQEHQHDSQQAALQKINSHRCAHQTEYLKLSHGLCKLAYRCAKRFVETDTSAHNNECPEAVHLPATFKYSSASESYYISKYPDTTVKTDKALTDKAIDSWYNEATHYDFEQDTPKQSDALEPVKNFSTMVWASLKEFGIGFYKSEEKSLYAVFALYGPSISDMAYEHEKEQNVFPCVMDPCSCPTVPPEMKEIKERIKDGETSSSIAFQPIPVFLYFFLYFNFHFLMVINNHNN